MEEFNIHKSPLRGPQCCTHHDCELDEQGRIKVMSFYHIHCHRHRNNCDFCPETRIAPGVRCVPIRKTAAKALELLHTMDVPVE